MKTSNYNFFYDYPNSSQILAYNSRTGALALMDNDKYSDFKQFMLTHDIHNLDDQFKKDLVFGGFLLDQNVDELELIKMNLMQDRYSTKHLGLTIATTINCNLGCTYCYEKENKNAYKMSDEVHQAIINMVKARATTLSSLSVTWYGGEPLLAMDTIKYLSAEFINICEENDIHYDAGIITNGYMLTPKIAQELKACCVSSAQITIDGPEHIHNERRPLIGGQPTFNRILKNTKEAAEIIDSISVRINIDEDNAQELEPLLNTLDGYGLKEKVSVYLGHVHNANECYQNDACLTTESYSHMGYDFDKNASQQGFQTSHLSYPTPIGSYCTADTEQSYVIDPEGYIYGCWVDIGNKELAIKNIINDNFQHNTSTLLKYMMYDPCEDDHCKNCSFLPLCMGGCPYSRITKNVDRCSNYKYVMEKKILDYADFTIANLAL